MGAIVLKYGFFRCLKSEKNQKYQEMRWDGIRRLRNRIFHHERIIHWNDLPQQHKDLIETIGWISPDLEDMSLQLDRFAGVHRDGITPWIEAIRSHWPKQGESNLG